MGEKSGESERIGDEAAPRPGLTLSFVRTNALPLPGFTCKNSITRHGAPSISILMPFLMSLLEIP